MYQVKRRRKPVYISIKQVSQIVGLSEQRIRKLVSEGRFPKKHSSVGRPRWSRLKVYNWLHRWGIPSERKRK